MDEQDRNERTPPDIGLDNKLPGRNRLKRWVADGVWEDVNGNLHFQLPRLLEMFELEDTPENRSIAFNNIMEMIQRDNPEIKIIYRNSPEE